MREYQVEIGGLPHTLQLTDADAERLSAVPVERKAAPDVDNKARTPRNKAAK